MKSPAELLEGDALVEVILADFEPLPDDARIALQSLLTTLKGKGIFSNEDLSGDWETRLMSSAIHLHATRSTEEPTEISVTFTEDQVKMLPVGLQAMIEGTVTESVNQMFDDLS